MLGSGTVNGVNWGSCPVFSFRRVVAIITTARRPVAARPF